LLPSELLNWILSSDQLQRQDLKAVRLSCRALAPAAASRLFFHVSISKLVAHRNRFLAICHTAHLAQHVREVEWQEISYAVGDFYEIWGGTWHTTGNDGGVFDIAALCRHFEDKSQRLFWLFNSPLPTHARHVDYDAIEAARRDAVALFRPVFESAVDKLTNLHTFVSRPMPHDRVLCNDIYAISAWYLQFLPKRGTDGVHLGTPLNDGLFLFFLPAMTREASTVTRLQWVAEFPGSGYHRPFPHSAFNKLESLEMVIPLWPSSRLEGLERALTEAAPTLGQFKLSPDDQGVTSLDGTAGRLILQLLGGGQFALRSLSLASLPISRQALLKVVQANATSLRHLTMVELLLLRKPTINNSPLILLLHKCDIIAQRQRRDDLIAYRM
jgi:hypothetical protein